MEYLDKDLLDPFELETSELLDIESLLKEERIEIAAQAIIEGTFKAFDILKKDSLDKLIDFMSFKIKTGYSYIINLAYPTMRMHDRELERKLIELINIHLNPDIILKLLKHFTRNIHNPDTNLHIAFLIEDDTIIKSIYSTFLLFKKDIFIADPSKRTLNVKRIQQFPPATDNKNSSPLDAAARLKYVLEFLALKQNVSHIYRQKDIMLSDYNPDFGS